MNPGRVVRVLNRADTRSQQGGDTAANLHSLTYRRYGHDHIGLR